MESFLNTTDRPTFIIVDSHIAYGAPHKQDTESAHGEPLGEDEIRLAKRNYGWPEDAKFLVPDGVVENFRNGIGKRGRELRTQWEQLFERYRKDHPDLADQVHRMQHRELPDGWDKDLPDFSRRCQRHCQPRIFCQSAERFRKKYSLADWRRR